MNNERADAALKRAAISPSYDTRRARLLQRAAVQGVPLPTILAAVGVVVGVYLLARLAYRLRDLLLLMLIAAFLALVLNPFVAALQRRWLRRRGLAVAVVVLIAVAAFAGLVAALGHPVAAGVRHLASRLPAYVDDAEHGRGLIGRLVVRFHLQQWVHSSAPQLQHLGATLARSALTFAKGTLLGIGELLAVFTLVVLLLIEAPKMRSTLLGGMNPAHADWWQHVGTKIRLAVVGFVVGDLLTSLVAGVVVAVTMAVLGLPFPYLWGLWVALVDFLPQVGGALAGIPAVVYAALHSLTDGIVVAVVFVAYQQLENHVLNPIVMSRTVRVSPLLVFIAVLIGGSIGSWAAGPFGAVIMAILAVPVAASIQIVLVEVWRATASGGSSRRYRIRPKSRREQLPGGTDLRGTKSSGLVAARG